MADYERSYARLTIAEGGYTLTNSTGDHGGQTYAGISRRFNPDWAGWAAIDAGKTPDIAVVRDWYKAAFWDPILGDRINDDRVAYSLFNFAVNTSAARAPASAVRVLQRSLGVDDDGVFGEETLAAVNAASPDLLLAQFALGKVRYHADICHRDATQLKWLVGWINRDLAV